MGRAYTDEERKALRKKIKEIAADMFGAYGFKAFRIQMLTEKAGISLGGFYNFYKDKESLYNEILRDEKNKIRSAIAETIEKKNISPQDFFKDWADGFLRKTATNKLYAGDNAGLLEVLVWNEDPAAARDNADFIKRIREIWKKKNMNISLTDEQIGAAIAAIAVLCANRQKIGNGFDFWFPLFEALFIKQI
ncbi:TetR/AcrR family transcriptional regulator [Treponema sp. OMZ 840]|uniref:TetR/AcrR family transcriptional regulator n=1 Tax=Treponema sp. OMZ 840 TaxID=244313 RepID=UPI003D94FA6E